MSTTDFLLSAQNRTLIGKGASRRLRKTNQVPAVIYGGKDDKPQSISLSHNHVVKALENEAVYSNILTLDVDGKQQKAVLKDLQRHPFKPTVMHMDFLRVSASERINMNVPVHFLNEETAPGIKQQGGSLSKQLNEVEIRCLPSQLPEFLEIDLAEAVLDQVIHLSDIKMPEGVELVALSHEHDLPVASIHAYKGSKADDESEATDASEDKE